MNKPFKGDKKDLENFKKKQAEMEKELGFKKVPLPKDWARAIIPPPRDQE